MPYYTEKFDQHKLNYILQNESCKDNIRPDVDLQSCWTDMESYLKRSRGGKRDIFYKDIKGRMYGRGMQGMVREVRDAIAGEYYNDLDIVNCHPTILKHILDNRCIECDELTEYINDREALINDIIKKNEGINRGSVKDTIISILFGGAKGYNVIKNKTKWLKLFKLRMFEITEILANDAEFKDFKPSKEFNREGSYISSLITAVEGKIINSILKTTKIDQKGKRDVVLMFDGMMLPKDQVINIPECLNNVLLEVGIKIQLKVKPMVSPITFPDLIDSYCDECDDWNLIRQEAGDITCFERRREFINGLVLLMNKSYCWAKLGDGFIINTYSKDGKPTIKFRKLKGMKTDFSNKIFKTNLGIDKFIEAGKELKDKELEKANEVDIWKLWLESMNRREVEDIVFDPESYIKKKHRPSEFNLYTGPGISMENVDSIEIDKDFEQCEFFNHIRDRWCSGNIDLYEAILNRFAHMIQYPYKKMKSCLVLKSVERAGKGIIIQIIGQIIGEEYMFQPTQPDDVLGNFNGLMAKTLLCFIDEMVWGGNKEKAGVMKKLITEDNTTINEKNMPKVKVKNLANVVIASNEDWIIPCGLTDVRYQVVELKDELATMDKKRKNKIVKEITGVNKQMLAKFFYDRDISGYNPNDIIQTSAGRYQKAQSLSNMGKWWLDVLNRGFMVCENTEYKLDTIPKEAIFEAYIEFSKDRHMTRVKFWIDFKKYNTTKTTQKGSGINRYRVAKLQTLEESREKWRTISNDPGWTFEDIDLPDLSQKDPLDEQELMDFN